MNSTIAKSAPKKRILVIDDRRDAVVPLTKMLALNGHEVQTAADGPSGISTAQLFQPQIILCDIGLTGEMNGYEVAQRVRQTPELAGVYLVAVTGYSQEEDRRLAQDAGFDFHLTKPVSLAVITDIVVRTPRFEPK